MDLEVAIISLGFWLVILVYSHIVFIYYRWKCDNGGLWILQSYNFGRSKFHKIAITYDFYLLINLPQCCFITTVFVLNLFNELRTEIYECFNLEKMHV